MRYESPREILHSGPGAGTFPLGLAMLLVLAVLAAQAAFPVGAQAQVVTFTYMYTCNIYNDPNCPRSNLVVATQPGQIASDSVTIATVNSDVPGYTNPFPITAGSVTWQSSPATKAQCLTLADYVCSATYADPGGSVFLTGGVFGLPPGSTLLQATFQGGASSYLYTMSGVAHFYGQTNISYINPVILANLGMANLRNYGTGILSDTFEPPDSSGNEYFNVSITFQPGNFQVLHNFTGGTDGSAPIAGLTMDKAGNLYGTAFEGGSGYGTVFKMTHSGSGWVFNPIYTFQGGSDGAGPQARVVFGPDGSLYGTTSEGGGCSYYSPGCGTVFNLRPRPTSCKSVLCPWMESVIYSFQGNTDGWFPVTEVAFDSAGNAYGSTSSGGAACNCGIVYELIHSGGSWTENILHTFSGGSDGGGPSSVVLDKQGNLYGTAYSGGTGDGTIYQLKPSGGGWTDNILYTFQGGNDGGHPLSGLIFDPAGNLYGSTTAGGSGGSGTAFLLAPSGGGWNYSVLYDFTGPGGGPQADLVMDGAGNLYGTTSYGGYYGSGVVFKLTPSGGGWTYSALYDFTGGNDGGRPLSSLVVDASGNVYGTTFSGGSYGGVVFQITP